jgi:hypothetical protein
MRQDGEVSTMATYHELEMITVLALLEYTILGIMVGRARQTYGVQAPATTGNPISSAISASTKTPSRR